MTRNRSSRFALFGSARHVDNLVRMAATVVSRDRFAELSVHCNTASELANVLAALQHAFARGGRGTVTMREAHALPGRVSVLVDHTDIGSDSENDPQITVDDV